MNTMNTFAYRLLYSVMWCNEGMALTEVRRYINNLWDEMSERERELISPAIN